MKTRLGSLAFAILLLGLPAPAAPPDDKPAVPSLTAEDILAKYLKAIGGARLQRVKTIVKRSESTRGAEQRSSITYRRAPDLYAVTTIDSKANKNAAGFDGKTIWVLPSRPLEEGQQLDFEVFLESAPLVTEFRIRPYQKVKLLGIKKVADRNAYAVGLIQGPAEQSTYFIDSETFLLLQVDWSARYKLPIGNVAGKGFPVAGPSQKDIRGPYLRRSTTYYLDWHEVNGVKLPFEVRSTGDFHGTSEHGETFDRAEGKTKVLEYQIDVPVDNSVFAPPPSSVKRAVK